MVPPAGFLAGVREICDRYGIVYIADEVMCGFGRTGSWFAYQDHDVKPDLVTFAKGVNSGYVPLGGVVLNEEISASFNERVYPGGLTYSGHPLACAVGRRLPSRPWRTSRSSRTPGVSAMRFFARDSKSSPPSTAIIGEVRGLGVFFALDLVTDRATKEPLAPYGGTSPAINEILAACRNEGLLIFNNYHRMHVVPPCTITDDEARDGLARLDRALGVADKHYVGA